MKRQIFHFLASKPNNLSRLKGSICGKGYNQLQKLIEAQQSKRSVNYFTEDDVFTEYSPVHVAPQEGLKKVYKILTLLGQPKVNFSQYSGYVTVDPNAGRALFYYFTESEDPSSKPLVLWPNGGKIMMLISF
ncbi:unnamed protein product [Fraxinus pennsylvanica]|uniref:Uncharacterized protein n=1 Tax=Fraxinus pennsylvanica TaxID=56036 RepID=A0AAD1ZIB2_9LAMI|nr:unnamed protein product [Fraxinus pennsylvanica]